MMRCLERLSTLFIIKTSRSGAPPMEPAQFSELSSRLDAVIANLHALDAGVGPGLTRSGFDSRSVNPQRASKWHVGSRSPHIN